MNTDTQPISVEHTRTVKFVSWGLRILAGAVFIAAGSAKLAGVPMMVAIFDQVGLGQGFRLLTGVVEIIGGIALLVPATAAFGGLLLAVTMVFAVAIHLFIIGGSPVPAIVLFVMTATVAWLHRARMVASLRRLRAR
jgi:putative oxidoreductase